MVSAQRVTAQSMSTPATRDTMDRVRYTLRPGDIVRLRIWREPDLSGDFPVDELGRVNFPLIGTLPVTDLTRESLHEKLLEGYRKSVENLSMDVIFLRRVAVTGAVRTPGLYPIDPTMTVGDAVAMAGGSTLEAAKTRINLLRSGKAFMSDVDPATLVSLLPIQRGDQLYIPPQEGFIARNPWVIGTVIQGIMSVAVAIVTISKH